MYLTLTASMSHHLVSTLWKNRQALLLMKMDSYTLVTTQVERFLYFNDNNYMCILKNKQRKDMTLARLFCNE